MKLSIGNKVIRDAKAAAGKEKLVNIRYRLRDGRKIELYYSSDYRCKLCELAKFNENFTPKDIMDYSSEIFSEMKDKVELLTSIYEESHPTTSEELTKLVQVAVTNAALNVVSKKTTIISFINKLAGSKSNKRAASTVRHYTDLRNELARFLYVTKRGAEFEVKDIDREFVDQFTYFLRNESQYREDYPEIYKGLNGRIGNKNAVSVNGHLKVLSYVLSVYNVDDKMYENPFNINTVGDIYLKEDEHYAYSLQSSQIWKMYNHTNWIGKERQHYRVLERTRKIFLVQCFLGIRDSDYRNLTDENIGMIKTTSGKEIYYLMYRSQKTGSVVTTPLIDEAKNLLDEIGGFEAVKKELVGLKNYNINIRHLMEEFDFECVTPHLKNGQIVHSVKLCEVASSKLARCTFVTLTAEYSVNLKASGLHSTESAASHYFHKNVYKQYRNLMAAFHDADDAEIIDDVEETAAFKLPKFDLGVRVMSSISDRDRNRLGI